MRRPHRGDDLSPPLGPSGAVAGGRDLFLPGDDIRLGATRWIGTGVPILLLHGLASQRRFWNLVVPDLVGRPVCALDQRGHGDSDKPDDGYDLSTVAGDATTALDALGWSRAVVVGHSWGASVAATLAAEHPDRVLAVVLLDGGIGPPIDAASREELRRKLSPPRIEERPEDLPEMLRECSPLKPWWSEAVEAALLPIFEVGGDGMARARLTRERHEAVVEGLVDYDAEAVLPRIAAPCWTVAALPEAGDERWQGALERATELLPRPRGFGLRGALHDVPLQWPALVAGIVRAAADEVTTQAEGRR